jgi:hypothetical protein
LKGAKDLSFSFLYWMQTDAPRPDGKTGFKGLRLRKDIVGTEDGMAKYPYIRESRRIQAEFTILEHHVGTDMRAAIQKRPKEEATAEVFADSVGVGCYRIDLHPSAGGTNYIDISSLPFQIPLGALIPKRMENLLPASKNIGATHTRRLRHRAKNNTAGRSQLQNPVGRLPAQSHPAGRRISLAAHPPRLNFPSTDRR